MVKKIFNEAVFKLYNAGWAVAIPFLKKNSRMAEGFDQRVLDGVSLPEAGVWIQAASGGEAYLALELLKRIRFKERVSILVTSNTTQGLEILAEGLTSFDDTNMVVTISYAPFDHPGIISKAVSQVKPKVMVLLELELWPGLLKALKNNNCKTIVINGRLTQKSLKGYLKWPSLWRDIAPCDVLAISESDAGRFKSLFPEAAVGVMHNIKFDRVSINNDDVAAVNPLRVLKNKFRNVIVLGSVRAEEENAVGRMICHLLKANTEVDIWLFPRHMDRVDFWKQFLDKHQMRWTLRSEKNETESSENIILWDRFGELSYAYKVADAAFVGGSLAPLGGQNFLEVLSAGLLPVTGPSWGNFLWTGEEILENKLLYKEEGWEKVSERLLDQISNFVSRDEVRARLVEYIERHQGGTQVASDKIKEIYYGHC